MANNREISFMCIGVQKAGTTSLHEILKQHPNINLPKFKETHFFSDDDNFTKGIDYYFDKYFKKIKSNQILGEIDPEYFFFTKAIHRLADIFKDIKIILILRNPVERAFSQYNMTCRRGYEKLCFMEAVEAESSRLITHFDKTHFSYINRSLYYERLKLIFDTFRKENIKIITHDDYKSYTKSVIQELCDFINVPFYDFDLNIKKNKASSIKSKTIRDFIYKDNFLKKIGGSFIKSEDLKLKLMQKIEGFNLKEDNLKQLNAEQKTKIYHQYFKNDIALTESLLNINLNHWKYNY